jgi:hypothetical protein
MIMWKLLKRLDLIFTVFGGATAAAATIFAIVPDAVKEGTFLESFQLRTAKLLTPKGYVIQPATLGVVPENATFPASSGTGALLRHPLGTTTFAMERGTNAFARIWLDGKAVGLRVGESAPMPGGCTLWLYRADTSGPTPQWDFQTRC